jgi:hypothetical protein
MGSVSYVATFCTNSSPWSCPFGSSPTHFAHLVCSSVAVCPFCLIGFAVEGYKEEAQVYGLYTYCSSIERPINLDGSDKDDDSDS